MADLANALREEITRLARKEVKVQLKSAKQAVTQHRRDIASLKRDLKALEKKTAFLEAQEKKRIGQRPAAGAAPEGARFSSRSVKAQRQRLQLSAGNFGKLIGVSGQTIYHWEQGKSRPRQAQLASLVAVRGLGKREASARLNVLTASNGRPATKAKKKGRKKAKR